MGTGIIQVQATRNPLDGARIHRMDGGFEAAGDPLAFPIKAEAGLDGLKVAEGRPEQALHQPGIPDLVGMGKVVPGRRCGSADTYEL